LRFALFNDISLTYQKKKVSTTTLHLLHQRKRKKMLNFKMRLTAKML
jgi:hypothetical protein